MRLIPFWWTNGSVCMKRARFVYEQESFQLDMWYKTSTGHLEVGKPEWNGTFFFSRESRAHYVFFSLCFCFSRSFQFNRLFIDNCYAHRTLVAMIHLRSQSIDSNEMVFIDAGKHWLQKIQKRIQTSEQTIRNVRLREVLHALFPTITAKMPFTVCFVEPFN